MLRLTTLNKPLGALFPADDPDSPWLLRLAILRDDLSFELDGIKLNPDDGLDGVWRSAYFLRKLTVSLDEVRNIFRHDLKRALEAGRFEETPEFAEWLAAARKQLEVSCEYTSPIRNGLGAHVRPSNAVNGQIDPTKQVLTVHCSYQPVVQVDLDTGRHTSLRQLNAGVFLFAWPDVRSVEDFGRKHDEFSSHLFPAFRSAIQVIDALLCLFWRRTGLLNSDLSPKD